MQHIILALSLIALNVDLLFLLNVSPEINIAVSRKVLTRLLVLTIAIISMFVIANPGKYLYPCSASIGWMGLLAMRHFMYKVLAAEFERGTKINKLLRRIFEIYVYPFFALVISLYQCIYLFVWANP